MIAPGAPELVLASTSRYRRELLERLVPGFRVIAPGRRRNAAARRSPDRARGAARRGQGRSRSQKRLRARSSSAAIRSPSSTGRPVGKSGSRDAAIAQLTRSSGRTIAFHTAIAVADTRTSPPAIGAACDRTEVVFRTLSADEIARYVDRENPIDCAGSFKAEAAGIALFERIRSEDPTALIGLPQIALAKLLRAAGFTLP